MTLHRPDSAGAYAKNITTADQQRAFPFKAGYKGTRKSTLTAAQGVHTVHTPFSHL